MSGVDTLNTLIQQAMADLKNVNTIIADNKALISQGQKYGPATTASIDRTIKHAEEVRSKMIPHIEKIQAMKKEIWKIENPEEHKRIVEDAAKHAKMVGFLFVGIGTVAAIAGSIFIYQRFFSKAAKACKGKKGFDRDVCISKIKIAGYEASIKTLNSKKRLCGRNEKSATCVSKINSKINRFRDKIRKQKSKVSEGMNMKTNELIIEGYINYLFDPNYSVEKEWRGNNIPVEHDCKPNWIRECMLLDCDKAKITCLRKLRETSAMNPFYQHRIDRFVDAITQTYEPTDEPGMVAEVEG